MVHLSFLSTIALLASAAYAQMSPVPCTGYSCPATDQNLNPLVPTESTASSCVYANLATSHACVYEAYSKGSSGEATLDQADDGCPSTTLPSYMCEPLDDNDEVLVSESGEYEAEYNFQEYYCYYNLPSGTLIPDTPGMYSNCTADLALNIDNKNYAYVSCSYAATETCMYDSSGNILTGNPSGCPTSQTCVTSDRRRRGAPANRKARGWVSRTGRAMQFSKARKE